MSYIERRRAIKLLTGAAVFTLGSSSDTGTVFAQDLLSTLTQISPDTKLSRRTLLRGRNSQETSTKVKQNAPSFHNSKASISEIPLSLQAKDPDNPHGYVDQMDSWEVDNKKAAVQHLHELFAKGQSSGDVYPSTVVERLGVHGDPRPMTRDYFRVEDWVTAEYLQTFVGHLKSWV